MLHVKDSLFFMVCRYTPGVTLARRQWVTWLDGALFLEQPESTVRYSPLGNLTGRFLNSAVFSLLLRMAVGHILCDDFSTPNETFSPPIKKSPKPCRFRRHL